VRDIPRYLHPTFKRMVPTKVQLSSNGRVHVDLDEPDEASLLPEWWNGRYPRISNKDRITKLSEQQGHRCCYCGVRTWSKHYGERGSWMNMATIEHFRCKTHGGTFRYSNIVMACSQCNNQRALGPPVLFMYEKQGLLDLELVPKE